MGIFASKESRTSGGNENERLLNGSTIPNENLETLVSTKPTLLRCRIYKVPCYLRNVKKKAYTPQVISIGPIHHDKKRFQTMENHKDKYFTNFIDQLLTDTFSSCTIC